MITSLIPQKKHVLFLATILFSLLLSLAASNAHADDDNWGGYATNTSGYGAHAGGYSGPGPALVTVAQAKGMSDDAHVALKGHIVQSLGGKDYMFKDATGTITVEISNKRWQGQNIGPNDLVEIHGEVDKEWTMVEIDVKRIIKQ